MLKIGSVSISHPWNGLAGSTPIPGIDHPKTKSIAQMRERRGNHHYLGQKQKIEEIQSITTRIISFKVRSRGQNQRQNRREGQDGTKRG